MRFHTVYFADEQGAGFAEVDRHIVGAVRKPENHKQANRIREHLGLVNLGTVYIGILCIQPRCFKQHNPVAGTGIAAIAVENAPCIGKRRPGFRCAGKRNIFDFR